MQGENAMIDVQDVSKAFTLHNQGGAVIEVMAGASLIGLQAWLTGETAQ